MSNTQTPHPISIWEPRRDENGRFHFIRPQPLALGDHYAGRISIPAEKAAGTTRICFFGESAAAGYLYAPHITPAKVLEHHLNKAASAAQYEVIDLARTNERIDTLVATAEQAMQLQPDMLVVFAGNNWNLLETPEVSPYYPSVIDRQSFAKSWQEQGWMGPVEWAAKQMMNKVGVGYGRLQTIAQQANIPLIVIIPEVNLADWETRQPAPWMGGENGRFWYDAYFAAVDAIANEQWQVLLKLADDMLTLDNEQCPTSWRLLATAHQGLGNAERSRLAAEMAINTTHYATLGFLAAPQISVMGQELLRRTAKFHDFQIVDLPQILPQITGSHLPGRDLFADYCHLTEEGMHVTMGLTTAEILGQSAAPLIPQLTRFAASPEAIAAARFGAAMHTAHRHLPVNPNNEMIRYWCEQALAASPSVVDAMLDVAEARCAPLPAVLTAAQQRNVKSPFRLQHQHGWQYPYLDAALIDAMLTVLAAHNPAAHEQMLNMIVAARGIGAGDVELLAGGFYLWEPLARFYPETMSYADIQKSAIFRAAWPETSFALVVGGETAVSLTLTHRLPYPDCAGLIDLMVNNHHVSQLNATNQWQTNTVKLPTHSLEKGLNKLTIKWPPLPERDGMTHTIHKLNRGEAANLYPVFGELFSVTIRKQS
jgi:hypothetical protein